MTVGKEGKSTESMWYTNTHVSTHTHTHTQNASTPSWLTPKCVCVCMRPKGLVGISDIMSQINHWFQLQCPWDTEKYWHFIHSPLAMKLKKGEIYLRGKFHENILKDWVFYSQKSKVRKVCLSDNVPFRNSFLTHDAGSVVHILSSHSLLTLTKQ